MSTNLAELYRDKLDAMFCYALARIGNADLAADLIHDVYLRVWQAFCDGREIEHLSGYTWRAVKMAIIDYKRTRRARTQHVPLYYSDTVPAPDHTSRVDDADQVRYLLATTSMTDEQRQAVKAYYLAEQTADELAEQLDIRRGAVKGRVHRGLTKLREAVAA